MHSLETDSWNWGPHRLFSSDISCLSCGLLSDCGYNPGHWFMETYLHGKWLINAGARIIVRWFPNGEHLCVLLFNHTNPRVLCVDHFNSILGVQFMLPFYLGVCPLIRNSGGSLGTRLLLQGSSARWFRQAEVRKSHCFHFLWPSKETISSTAAKFQMLHCYEAKEGRCSFTCLSKGKRICLFSFLLKKQAPMEDVIFYIPVVFKHSRPEDHP